MKETNKLLQDLDPRASPLMEKILMGGIIYLDLLSLFSYQSGLPKNPEPPPIRNKV